MGKKLAIRGHSSRGNEVIKLLEMMGGKNIHKRDGEANMYSYYLFDYAILSDRLSIVEDDDFVIFTLEEFLEKYPFKVGDKVFDIADGDPGIIADMKWDEDVSDIKYRIAFDNGDMGWFTIDTFGFLKKDKDLGERKTMNKKLAIKGHSTRGKEVIELLEMMGGVNSNKAYGNLPNNWDVSYYIFKDGVISVSENKILTKKQFEIFTLEEFLEKYPFKVGDKIFLYDNITEGCVTGMKWDEEKGTVKYCVYTSSEYWCDVKELLKWNAIDLVERHYQEQCGEMAKDITLKHLYERGMENIKDEFRKEFCECCGSQRCSGQDDELEYCERFKNIMDNSGTPFVENHKMGPESKIPSKFMKGCNCAGGCKHHQCKEKYLVTKETDIEGKITFSFKEFVGYDHYCDKHPDRYEQFSKENDSKLSTWVSENVVMDCYEPNETQVLLDDMHRLLDELHNKMLGGINKE